MESDIGTPSQDNILSTSLPNQWVMYRYDKQLFKKIANRPNFQAKPHKELCTLDTINDLIYLMQLMETKCNRSGEFAGRRNLDSNDYIIMRKGIEPIWEDPKNWNGGTFTIKMSHTNGFNVWSLFVMHMLGETLTEEMQYINGITVSYISDSGNPNTPSDRLAKPNNYTYIKIWDGKPDRTREQFISSLPKDIYDNISTESLQYSQNNKKNDFNKEGIVGKLANERNQGGFKTTRGRGRERESNYGRRRY